ncbi:MAG: HD domain-containing protein [Dehalococcoidales bacterium]
MTASGNKQYSFTVNQALSHTLGIITNCLKENNIRGYLVGGVIRDGILRRPIDDIDIITDADPQESAPKLAELLNGKYVPFDKENRTTRIMPADTKTGKLYHVDISAIKNTLTDDLLRRDFTVNAMAVPLELAGSKISGSDIIDPFNGLGDIAKKVLRAVSAKSFQEDPLRLLRAVRLATELNFKIEPETETRIKKECQLISSVSGERIREELLKLLALPQTGDLFLYTEELGLVSAVIPELIPSKGLEQPSEHYWDVFIHSVKTIDAIGHILGKEKWEYNSEAIHFVPQSAETESYFNAKVGGSSTRLILLKLTALLHDIAKPKMKFIDENGRIRFFGHPKEGAPMVFEIMERLRFSNKETKIVEKITKHHLRPTQMTQMGIVTDHAIYRYFRDVGDVAIDTLYFTLADHLAARGPTLDIENWKQHTAAVKYILQKHQEQESKISLPPIINGNEIMREFGLTPGPQIGELLETVREAQASGEIADRIGALDYIRGFLRAKS